ncbi:enoyl-CoA hydratase/isomerase family protein, partial [Achromobacter denitrificans]
MSATPTPDSPLILRQRDGDIVTVVLNRPEKLNAFTIDSWRLLGDIFLELDADDSVRCVLLRGAGGGDASPGN